MEATLTRGKVPNSFSRRMKLLYKQQYSLSLVSGMHLFQRSLGQRLVFVREMEWSHKSQFRGVAITLLE